MSKKKHPEAVGNRLIVIPVKEDKGEEKSVIFVPEKFEAPYGKTATGQPHKIGKIVGIGPKVKEDQIKLGDIVIIDGMNAHPFKIQDQEYYSIIPAAILLVVTDD